MLASALPDTLPAAGATPTQRALHEAALARRQRLGLVPVRTGAPVPKPRAATVVSEPAPRPAPASEPVVAVVAAVPNSSGRTALAKRADSDAGGWSALKGRADSQGPARRPRGAVPPRAGLEIAVEAGLTRAEMVVVFGVTHAGLAKGLAEAGLVGVPAARRQQAVAAVDLAVEAMLAAGATREEIEARLGLSKSGLSKSIRRAGLVGRGRARLRAEAAARVARETEAVRRGLQLEMSVSQLATVLGVSAATVSRRIRDAGLDFPARTRVGPAVPQLTADELAVQLKALIATTAARYRVSEEALLGRTRAPRAQAARAEALVWMIDELGMTRRECGRVLDGRDHSSVNWLYLRAKRETGN